MNNGFLLPADLCPSFRQETVGKILEISKKGECLQLVGLPGSGKTILLSALATNFPLLAYHLKDKKQKISFKYLNLNLIPEKNTFPILKSFTSLLNNDEQEAKDEIKTIRQSLTKLTLDSNLVIIFDAFDCLENINLSSLFEILKSFLDEFKFRLSYIFAVDREIDTPEKLGQFSKIAILLCENIVYLPLLSKKDVSWYIDATAARQMAKSLTTEEKIKVAELSGGFMRTIKRLIQTINSGVLITELEKNPGQNIHLNYLFESLMESLKEEEETLRDLILGNLGKIAQENLKKLINLQIVNSRYQFTQPLLEIFLRQKYSLSQKIPEQIREIKIQELLTANEYKIFNYLLANMHKIVKKEELITAVWGENATLTISNHALDQLVFRLRRKIKSASPTVTLQTIRGRGYRLE